MTQPPLCAPPDPDPRPPAREIPRGACDCHLHIIDGPSVQISERSYTSPEAPLAAYRKVQAALGLDRAVIVQPSIFGTDNRTTLGSLPEDGSMRAVVVVDADLKADHLLALANRGAVGVRVNRLFSSNARTEDLTGLTRLLADCGMHLQMLTDVSLMPDLAAFVASLPVPVVFDHLGHVPVEKGINDPGFQTLLKLLETGKVWVKLSGAYRITTSSNADYGDVDPMARALVAANPHRLVWGSDWPHPAFRGPMPNDGDLLDGLFDWAGPDRIDSILVRNPQQLYGFPAWEEQHAQ